MEIVPFHNILNQYCGLYCNITNNISDGSIYY
jgi:hypothetical protein